MFFHLLYIHLFRPFLKYNPTTSPLPSHVSPKKLCTQAAGAISKLMRLYKRTYGLRQICNIAVYIVHSACTIHLLNIPEKTAKRDIVHGVKNLEEIAEDWLCSRRTLSILSVMARKWKVDLPEEALAVFSRTDSKFGTFSTADVPSPSKSSDLVVATPPPTSPPPVPQHIQNNFNAVRAQNQLQQSLYSYLPEAKSLAINTMQNQPSYNNNFSLPQHSQQSNGGGSMNIQKEPLLSSVPYGHYPYNKPASAVTTSSELPRSTSTTTTMSEATNSNSQAVTRQVSPSTMFGGVDALVESQDWWLRDQASLAVGFDNWMSTGTGVDLNNGTGTGTVNGTGSSGNINGSSPELGLGSDFYMPSLSERGNDDWNTYN